MTIHGHIENGRVVLDELIDLPDGTPVRVEAATGAAPAKGSPEAVLSALERVGPWEPPEEIDRLYADLQREKQAELRRSIESGEWDRSLDP